ncbi:MAG: hypothetical protein LUD72_01570 [Bacteroidales bacterium]|nr:hypothetical protein [Bacteroidales bacterium]
MRLGDYEVYASQKYRRTTDDGFIYSVVWMRNSEHGTLEVMGWKVPEQIHVTTARSEEKFRLFYNNIVDFLKDFRIIDYEGNCEDSKRDLVETMNLKLSELYIMSEMVMNAPPPRNHDVLRVYLERENEFILIVGRLFGRWLDHPFSNPYSVYRYAPDVDNIDFAEAMTIVTNDVNRELMDWCEEFRPSSTELIHNKEGKIRLRNHTEIINLADKFFGEIICWQNGKYRYHKEMWQSWKIDVMTAVQKYNTHEGITPVDKLPLE